MGLLQMGRDGIQAFITFIFLMFPCCPRRPCAFANPHKPAPPFIFVVVHTPDVSRGTPGLAQDASTIEIRRALRVTRGGIVRRRDLPR